MEIFRKKEFRSVTLRIGAAVLLEQLLFAALGGYGWDILYLLTGTEPSDTAAVLLDCFLYLFCFMLPVLFFRLISRKKGTEPMRLGIVMEPAHLLLLPIGIAVTGAAAQLNGLLMSFADPTGVFVSDSLSSGPETVLAFIASSLVPAVCEEFLFRGCVLSNLLPYGRQTAIFGSALLFALMHGNPFQFLYAFCAGLILGWVYAETGSVWPGMMIHLFNNFLSVAEDFLSSVSDDYYAPVLFYLLEAMVGLAGIICLTVWIVRKKGVPVREHFAADREKVRLFFSPTVIIFTVLSLLNGMRILIYCFWL